MLIRTSVSVTSSTGAEHKCYRDIKVDWYSQQSRYYGSVSRLLGQTNGIEFDTLRVMRERIETPVNYHSSNLVLFIFTLLIIIKYVINSILYLLKWDCVTVKNALL